MEILCSINKYRTFVFIAEGLLDKTFNFVFQKYYCLIKQRNILQHNSAKSKKLNQAMI